ncbi:hypothetical protein EIP91_007985, partial [Steccherinum ochraceum]
MFFAKALLVASVALSASAMITPHHARSVDHHAIAARMAQPEVEAPAVHVTPRKRALRKRCAPSSTTSSLSSSAHPTSSAPPAPV